MLDKLSKEEKKNKGITFTEKSEVMEMFELINIDGIYFQDFKILEPSCGSGNFIIYYLEHFLEQNISEEDSISLISNIYAYDIMDIFIKETKKRIVDLFKKYHKELDITNILNKNIVLGNFLEESIETKFDMVVGNPPYVRVHNLDDKTKSILKTEYYKEIYSGYADLSIYFMYKSFNVLAKDGFFMFITSNKFSTSKYGELFRKKFFKNLSIYVEKRDDVFKSVQISTSIIKIDKKSTKKFIFNNNEISKKEGVNEWNFHTNIKSEGTSLKELGISISNGLVSGYSKAHILDKEEYDKFLKEDISLKEYLLPILRGKDLKDGKYTVSKYIIFATEKTAEGISESKILMDYLDKHKVELKERSWYKSKKPKHFFELQSTTQRCFSGEKYLTKRIGHLEFIKVPDGILYMDTLFCLILDNSKFNISKLLPIIDKKIDYFESISNKVGNGYEVHKNKFERIKLNDNEIKEIKC